VKQEQILRRISIMEKQNELNFFCPYCIGEIMPETTQCPQCGYVYGPDTLNILTSPTQTKPQAYPTERRKHVRVHKTFKITYQTPKAFMKSYLYDIGTGGLFIRTNDPLIPGEMLYLRLFLPDEEKELEAFCEVVWVRKEERVTIKGKYPPGMGVRFVNPPKEAIERIKRVLSWKPTKEHLKVAAL
jgi:uncharacterized protein (TIGR02266 family)